MDILIRDPKFWTAVVLLLKVILFYVIPDFPPDIWTAIDAIIAVVIGALAGSSAKRVIAARRAAKG